MSQNDYRPGKITFNGDSKPNPLPNPIISGNVIDVVSKVMYRRAIEAIEAYGQHHHKCHIFIDKTKECTCGLEKVLRELYDANKA